MNVPVKVDSVISTSSIKADIDDAIEKLVYFRNKSLNSLAYLATIAPEGDDDDCLKELLEVVNDRVQGDFVPLSNAVMKLAKTLKTVTDIKE